MDPKSEFKRSVCFDMDEWMEGKFNNGGEDG